MTQRRLLISSYMACAILAIGSLGPWAYGPLSYSGTSGYGILTLLGAGLATLALWRWTVSGRRLLLIAAQGVAALCAVAVLYAFYYDIYDFYANADEFGTDRIGWGLILTLVAAIVLTALCFLQYRRAPKRLKSS